MATLELTFVDPVTTSFFLWAADLSDQLSSYNAPNPVTEDSWVFWAEQLCALPELAELGVPSPRAFSDWRGWATSLSQVLW